VNCASRLPAPELPSALVPVLKPRARMLLRSGDLPVAAWGEDLDGGGFPVRLQD
jgi:hypothetical protein